MAKDWITGRSWARGSSSSPFAMAALGFLQAMQQNQRRDEDKAEQERMMQQEEAMEKVKQGREMLYKVMALDPSLVVDPQFAQYVQTGDYAGGTSYLSGNGWKPKTAEEKLSLVDQMDNQVLEWQQKDPSGASWPSSVKNYATYKHKLFAEEKGPSWKTQLTDYGGAGKRVVRYNDEGGMEVFGPNGWQATTEIPGKPPSNGGGGGGGGGKGDDKEPNGLKRTDMDSVERWLFGGGYDPISGTMSPSWLDSMKKGKRPLTSVLAGIKNRYGSNPGLYNYAVSRVMGDPMSPYYGEGAPPPQPSPQPEPAPIPAKEPTVAGTEPTPKPQTKPSPTYWGLGTQFQEDNRIPIARAKYNALIVKANGDQRLIAQIKMKYRPE
jgi:hypothetical protein